MECDPLLDQLKTATRQLHNRLEARVDILNRLGSLQAYQQLVAAFYGFYVPIEKRLDGVGLKQVGLDLASRCKVPLLLADLRLWSIDADSLPCAVALPALNSVPQNLGCLYVLEGSTLGSQIIKRLLFQHLGIDETNGGAFFNAYGDRVRLMWDQFRQVVIQFASENPQHSDAMVLAAQQTFIQLERWFDQTLDRSHTVRQTGDDRQ
ncbi:MULTISPECIES: biliverdin-producing heme oxygenase [unclassified Schlesneria]|uniref:biliverdin-producing heme oxygenase n=1 Tax=Schlesneria TaxID=656899 RepID=UPI0035A030F3